MPLWRSESWTSGEKKVRKFPVMTHATLGAKDELGVSRGGGGGGGVVSASRLHTMSSLLAQNGRLKSPGKKPML